MTKRLEASTCKHCGSRFPCSGRRTDYCSEPCAVRSRISIGGPDECWPWTGGTNDAGYGQFRRAGVFRYAHRAAYELANGPLGALHVLHSCDNPRCCNPAHLVAGTARDNMTDMHKKGRWPAERVARGERVGGAKLSPDDVVAIRAAVAAGESRRALARRYGVSQGAIQAIERRRTWRHVT